MYTTDTLLISLAQTPVGPARNDDVVLRVQSRISNEKEKSFRFRQWLGRHSAFITYTPNVLNKPIM